MSGSEISCDVTRLFQKTFPFCIPISAADNLPWQLPATNRPEAADEVYSSEIDLLKANLNKLKNLLNDYDITKWHKHTTDMNPTSSIVMDVRRRIHPELCTQAWCKFHEILSFGNVIPEHAISTRKLNSVHLCEAPGAFVCSLNHFVKSHFHKIKLKWLASTLNPYYEGNDPNFCIADDRLIFKTLKSWCFGDDNTGDIFSRSTLDELLTRTKDMHVVHLVTADGSINCQLNPENQEKDTLPLKYAELFYALSILSPGGSFVLKTFTLFEFHSAVLMYILCCYFDSVSVRKPATSKPGNSEVYVIARGFHGKESSLQFYELLRNRFPYTEDRDLDLMSISALPQDFIRQHEACVRMFVDLQMATINRNMQLYKTKWLTLEYVELKQHVCETAIGLMGLRKINRNQGLLPCGMLQQRLVSNVNLRPKLTGSFTERNTEHEDSSTKLPANRSRHDASTVLFWKKMPEIQVPTLELIRGKKLHTIKSSLFCDTDILMRTTSKPALSSDTILHGVSECGQTTNNQLSVMLQEVATDCNCGEVLVVNSYSSDCWKHLASLCPNCASLRHMQTTNIASAKMSCCGLLLCSVVGHKRTLASYELETRKSLVDIACFVSDFLPVGSSFGCLVPSILTRFMAGLVWMLCQMFVRFSMVASDLPNDTSGVFLLCSKRKQHHGWKGLMQEVKRAFDELDANMDLLEVVPISLIMKDAEFVKILKAANHRLLEGCRKQ